MRLVLTAAVAVAVIGAMACTAGPPDLIAEADLAPPAQLEATLRPVTGWTMGPVESSKVSGDIVGDLYMTRAGTRYSKGNTIVTVDVTDSGLVARAVANLTSGYAQDTGRSQARSASVAGIPGVENWDGVAKEGLLDLLVVNRFVVSMRAGGIDDLSVLREFATHFDTTALASLRGHKAR